MQGIILKLDSSDLPTSLQHGLRSITVSESLDRIDEIQARFWLLDQVESSDLQWHGVTFEVTITNDSDERTLKGDVVEVAFQRRESGLEMTVRGLSTLHRLKVLQTSKAHEGTHSDIAKTLASNVSLGADVEGVSGSSATILQANETDAAFLDRLARQNNYIVRADDGKLRFVRPDSAGEGAAVELQWSDIPDIRVTHSLAGIVTGVTVLGYDSKTDELIKAEATDSVLKKYTGTNTGVSFVQSKFGNMEIVLDNTTFSEMSVAKACAEAELKRRAEKFVSGSLTTGLCPTARSGGEITINEAPWPLCGTFLIKEVVHIYEADEGYYTQIQFLSDSLDTP